jgi:hypothetical protein
MAEKSTNRRFRNFATVVYPDSAPENWISILEDKFIPSFISPIHDMDVNPDGEIKKSHYHVILIFEGKKSEDQAIEIFKSIHGVGCEVVQSIRGYARYLCHLDNPEKHQYSPEAVRSLCGADYNGVIGLVIDKYKAIKEMIEFIKLNNILSYSELLDYCSNDKFEWFRVLCDNGTVVIKEYLKSRLWSSQVKYKEVI